MHENWTYFIIFGNFQVRMPALKWLVSSYDGCYAEKIQNWCNPFGLFIYKHKEMNGWAKQRRWHASTKLFEGYTVASSLMNCNNWLEFLANPYFCNPNFLAFLLSLHWVKHFKYYGSMMFAGPVKYVLSSKLGLSTLPFLQVAYYSGTCYYYTKNGSCLSASTGN